MANKKGKQRGHWYSKALPAFSIALIFFIIALLVFIFYPWKEKPHKPPTIPPQAAKIEKPKPPEVKPHISKPKVAIVIDDMGEDIRQLRDILAIDAPIAVAILPFLPHSKDVAEKAGLNGREVLLHLPMEPKDTDNNDPGNGAVFTDMSEAQISEQVKRDIDAIPYAIGINNHMGSKFTENEILMRTVLEVAKSKNLFFLDSKTTSKSTAYRLAKNMGLRTASRQVFLDNEEDISYIKRQLIELIKIAKKNGAAIAIGHPHPATIAAIKEMLPRLNQDVKIVAVSSLIDSMNE